MTVRMSLPVVEEESSAVVDRLSSLLSQGPTHFEITILPGTNSSEDDCSGQMLSLDESLLLVDGRYLGLDARSLPSMTREIRQQYKRLKLDLERNQSGDDTTTIFLNTLSCLLLVNPDHATAWADRRRSLLQRTETLGDDANSLWTRELDFINLLMTQHSKAPFSWAHRKYVLDKVIQTGGDQDDWSYLLSLFENEVNLCRNVAERYPKNYYAWTHRRFVLGKILESTKVPVDIKLKSLEIEWHDIVAKWLPLHVSDHSAVHYASQVLEMWMAQLQNSSTRTGNIMLSDSLALDQLAIRVMTQVRCLMDSLESHETLWLLRRLVIRILWESKSPSCKTVVLGDVTAVATSIEHWRSNKVVTDKSVPPNIHALTFLAWVGKVLHTRNPKVQSYSGFSFVQTDSSKGLSFLPIDLLSLLRDHPQVYHCQWKSDWKK